jgi:hypothetical protein
MSFGTMILMASLGFLIKIGIGILAATVIKNFFRIFVRLMAAIAFISLIFYLPSVLIIGYADSLAFLQIPIQSTDGLSEIRHIGVYNFHKDFEYRNSGMFWEPGAFAGYLVLALFIVVTFQKEYSFATWEILILILALISTQSTMGYFVGFIVLLYCISKYFSKKSIAKKLVFIPVVLTIVGASTLILFTELEFIGDKIFEQIANTQTEKGNYQINRFGNVIYDMEFIREKPIFGWSGNPATRLALDGDALELISAQGVALTGFWVRFGVFGWLLLFIVFYKNSFDKLSGFFFIIIVAVMLIGEQYTNYPLIYAFLVPLRIMINRLQISIRE